MNNKFIISVVIPVYNVADYLEECLESITVQSIGIENIQVILVNDGSTDSSAAICLNFKNQYPDNVIYIEQSNAGVSAARNKGIELAEGMLTTFLDGDDKWSPDSFGIIQSALISNPEIEVFSCRMEFFDAKEGAHQLNYKYSEDKIINIDEDYNYPQMSSSSVFIKTDTVKRYSFTEGIKYSEDCRFINEILLDTARYMVLKDPIYMYRMRQASSSAMQCSIQDPDYYIPTCENVYNHLFALSIEKYGRVLRYVQYCVMYDLRWRLKLPLESSGLNKTDSEKYCSILKQLLKEIDDDIIIEQKRISRALQLFALELKYDSPVGDRIAVGSDGIIRYNNIPLYNIYKQTIISIDSVSASKEVLSMSGEVNMPFCEDRFELNYYVNDQKHSLSLIENNNNTKTYLYGVLKPSYDFEINIDCDNNLKKDIRFEVCFDNKSFPVYPYFSNGIILSKRLDVLEMNNIMLYRNDGALALRGNNFTSKAIVYLLKIRRRIHLN